MFGATAAFSQCPLNPTTPSVTICTPSDGASVTSPVHVVAATTDSNTVQYLQIYVDGVKVYEVLASTLDTNLAMSAGTHRLTVQAKDSAGVLFKTTIYITVSGSGSGSVTVSPTSLSFPSQTVNTTSSPQTVTLSNGTSSAVSIASIGATGDFAVAPNSCGTSLAAGANCSIGVTFTPTASGTRTGTLTITDSAGSQTVSLTGAGATSGSCTPGSTNPSVTICTPADGATVTSPVHVVAVTTDSNPVSYVQVYVDGVKVYEVLASSLDTNLTMSTGAHRMTVQAKDSAGVLFKSTINITVGSGGGTGSVTVSPTSLSFASQSLNTMSSPQTVTLGNGTAAAVSISGVTASGDFAVASNNCGSSLAAGGDCSIAVTFTPTATGTRTGTLTITDSAGTQAVSLTGTGASSGGCTPSSVNPSVTICTPTNGATVTSAVTVQAVTTDSSTVTLMQIYVDGAKVYQVSASPLNTTLSMSSGGHRLTVQAQDNAAVIFKSTINITVSGTSSGTLTVSPRAVSLTLTQTQQFAANATVTWSVDGIGGGNSTVGTISTNGLYTPGSATGQHSVTATNSSGQSASATVYVTSYAGQFTRQVDNSRTAQNTQEIALARSNVNSSQFGKLFTLSVDGAVNAQPLYVANLNMGTKGMHNVVYVATMADSVYAFDADGKSTSPLWHRTFVDPANGITTVPGADIGSTQQYGIVPTPVIDPASQTFYVLARTKENGSYFQRLHALDLVTGAEKFGGPVAISASVQGTGEGSASGTLAFDPLRENSRPGMLLINGTVLMAWASVSDIDPYHGWVIGYDAQTLQRSYVYVTTPNGVRGGIWQGAAALAADQNGNLFVTTGNGTFNANSGGSEYGDSFIKLSTAGGVIGVADYFTPFNESMLDSTDKDLGSGGAMLPPDQGGVHPHIIIAGGKEGRIYVVDRDNMGNFNSSGDTQVVQSILGSTGIYSAPGYWNGNVYIGPSGDHLKAYSLSNSLLSGSPTSQTSTTFGFSGAAPAISANGTSNGIVWAIERNTTVNQNILHAYDGTNLANELYNSTQAGSRDTSGSVVKFVTPLVGNGRVYVGCGGSVVVYGLLP